MALLTLAANDVLLNELEMAGVRIFDVHGRTPFEIAEFLSEASGAADSVQRPPYRTVGAADRDQLSGRERQVLRLVASGMSSKEIAVALKVSRKTVDFHRGNILRKTRAKSVADLTLYAVREGFLTAAPA
jgi:DNA-binding CsgD family transcriptional regulator